jgi:hypothetical protein
MVGMQCDLLVSSQVQIVKPSTYYVAVCHCLQVTMLLTAGAATPPTQSKKLLLRQVPKTARQSH